MSFALQTIINFHLFFYLSLFLRSLLLKYVFKQFPIFVSKWSRKYLCELTSNTINGVQSYGRSPFLWHQRLTIIQRNNSFIALVQEILENWWGWGQREGASGWGDAKLQLHFGLSVSWIFLKKKVCFFSFSYCWMTLFVYCEWRPTKSGEPILYL